MFNRGHRKRPIALIVLDGWGYSKSKKWNAIYSAKKPNFDFYWKKYPHTILNASGEFVGLPKGFIGGSEVGHIHLGAGRLVPQVILNINKSIKDGSFFSNKSLIRARSFKRVHLMGLLSDAGVHSHISHLLALMKFFKGKEVFVHCFLDGRDTPPRSASKYISMVEDANGRVATISGRYYAMDRDRRWERTNKAFDCLFRGKGRKSQSLQKALAYAYRNGEDDEFVSPTLIDSDGLVKKGDAVVFFNFRSDRARQLTQKMTAAGVHVVTMVKYGSDFKNDFMFAFSRQKNILPEMLSKSGFRQLRIAETEKYAHVTYFFNCERNEPFKGEDRILVHSPKVATYDMKPQMSALEVKNKLLKIIGNYDFILVNFANGDMVGHTGKMKATVEACETVDRCLGDVVKGIISLGGAAIVLGDHGNAEKLRDSMGVPYTAHTTNPVPCILINKENHKLRKGSLYDVAPTVLELLKMKKPREMTGSSLIKG